MSRVRRLKASARSAQENRRMTESKRREVIIGEAAAAGWIRDGMTVSIGGFLNSSHPMPLVRAIIRNGVKNLTVVGAASAGLETDLLIAAGSVKTVIAPMVSGESLAPIGPAFRALAQRGEIEVVELDEHMYYQGLRAAAALMPSLPWRGGVGTDYVKLNPRLKEFDDPITGERLIAIPAIDIDVALIHAGAADPYGNVQHVGTGFGDRAHHRAADRTIVTVEKVIANEEVRANPYRTSIASVDAVVRAPYGAHPFASPGHYLEDAAHIKDYVAAATPLIKDGSRAALDGYLDTYVREPKSHAEYLTRIGFERILSLHEY
jgi:glutaconate CoA-transferase subunit A